MCDISYPQNGRRFTVPGATGPLISTETNQIVALTEIQSLVSPALNTPPN